MQQQTVKCNPFYPLFCIFFPATTQLNYNLQLEDIITRKQDFSSIYFPLFLWIFQLHCNGGKDEELSVFICNYATTIFIQHCELLKFKEEQNNIFLFCHGKRISATFFLLQLHLSTNFSLHAHKKVVFPSPCLNNFCAEKELHLNMRQKCFICTIQSVYRKFLKLFCKRVHVTKATWTLHESSKNVALDVSGFFELLNALMKWLKIFWNICNS